MLDAVMAQDQSQTTGLWLVREQCAVALMDVSRRITPFDDDNIVGEDRKTINGGIWHMKSFLKFVLFNFMTLFLYFCNEI